MKTKDLQSFEINDTVSVIWDLGDEPMVCVIVNKDRGFFIMKEVGTGHKVIARPNSPWEIKIYESQDKAQPERVNKG